jgi:hypothetical protein
MILCTININIFYISVKLVSPNRSDIYAGRDNFTIQTVQSSRMWYAAEMMLFKPCENKCPVRLAYQPPASSTFLSEQTSHRYRWPNGPPGPALALALFGPALSGPALSGPLHQPGRA